MVSKLDMTLNGRPVPSIYSVVSSGLYAPWRFANAEPSNYMLDGRFTLQVEGQSLAGAIETPTKEGNAFAVVQVSRSNGGHHLKVELDSAMGKRTVEYKLDDWLPTPLT